MERPVIICVDDQREVLTSIVRDLNPLRDSVRIEECESAAEANALLDELEVDGTPVALIVCDHIMPGTTGVDFLTQLLGERRFPHTKRLLLTGQATHKDTIDAINNARIDYYIEKPWAPAQLLDVCRRLITDFLFDTGLYTDEFRAFADPKVLLARLKVSE